MVAHTMGFSSESAECRTRNGTDKTMRRSRRRFRWPDVVVLWVVVYSIWFLSGVTVTASPNNTAPGEKNARLPGVRTRPVPLAPYVSEAQYSSSWKFVMSIGYLVAGVGSFFLILNIRKRGSVSPRSTLPFPSYFITTACVIRSVELIIPVHFSAPSGDFDGGSKRGKWQVQEVGFHGDKAYYLVDNALDSLASFCVMVALLWVWLKWAGMLSRLYGDTYTAKNNRALFYLTLFSLLIFEIGNCVFYELGDLDTGTMYYNNNAAVAVISLCWIVLVPLYAMRLVNAIIYLEGNDTIRIGRVANTGFLATLYFGAKICQGVFLTISIVKNGPLDEWITTPWWGRFCLLSYLGELVIISGLIMVFYSISSASRPYSYRSVGRGQRSGNYSTFV